MQTKHATFSNDNQQNLFDEITSTYMPGEIQLDIKMLERLENWLKNSESVDYGNYFNVLVTEESCFQDYGMQGFYSEYRNVAIYRDKVLIVYKTGDSQNVHLTRDGDYEERGDTFCKILSVIAAPTEQQIQQAIHEAQEVIRKKAM
jgi:mRNA-degrading endonuclease YafQ of YafQ-DinJ toxin-antitoxin module